MYVKILSAFRQKLAFSMMVCLTLAVGLLVGAKTWFIPSYSEAAGADITVPVAAQPNQRKVRIDVEQLTYRTIGFERNEIRRPYGRFLLVIHNRSGARGLTFRLTREDRQLVHEIRLRANKVDWHGVINPPIGRYVLSNAARPESSCVIVIER